MIARLWSCWVREEARIVRRLLSGNTGKVRRKRQDERKAEREREVREKVREDEEALENSSPLANRHFTPVTSTNWIRLRSHCTSKKK